MTSFSSLETLEPDALLNLVALFNASRDPKKVNLSVGAYRDENGQPKVLDVVREVELEFASAAKQNKEYLPITGLDEFCAVSRELMFGAELVKTLGNRITSVQSLSGTGAVRLGMELVKVMNPSAKFFIPNPTWPNHPTMLKTIGIPFAYYRYFDEKTGTVDFVNLMNDLNSMPENSIVLLHACAHNPTGADPSDAQWRDIAQVCVRRKLFPFFDVAYQGYVSGDPAVDGAALRHFATLGVDMLACQSYAKIFGLYGERVGALHVIVAPSANVDVVVNATRSQLARSIRTMYSNPPAHGARIVARVLGDASLRARWLVELAAMAKRIATMRVRLRAELERCQAGGASRSWAHVTSQVGMFCFTGISRDAARFLLEQRSVFLMETGRISMAGVNEHNVVRVAECFRDALAATANKL